MRRVTTSSRMSVWMERLFSRLTDFREMVYWGFLLTCEKQIRVWLKSDKNDGQFTWAHMQIYDISLNSRVKKTSALTTVAKTNPHLLCYLDIFSRIHDACQMIQELWEQQRGRNKTAYGVRHDVVHRLYQDAFDCQNFVWLHGTCMITIICPHKKSRASRISILTKLT